jgi:glycosyltransferase involved in cell wall biosynthesis
MLLSTRPRPTAEHAPTEKEYPSSARRRALVVIRWPLGGIRTYVLYLYPHLLRAGYRFTFVGPADASFRSFCAELRDWPDVEFIEAPQHGRRCRLRPTVRQALRQRRHDLIHSHGFTAAADAVLGNLGIGVPHVVTSHDVFRADQVAGLRGVFKRWLLGLVLARTDCVVSVSRDAQDNLVRYLPGLAHSRTRLVPILNGIDVRRFAAERGGDDLRHRLGVGDDVFMMGFLGRFMEQKGFLPMLDALERLKREGSPRPFRLAAVGSGDYEREYREEVARRGLSDVVTFLPFTPDVGPVLRQLDLLVMPSLWEACPLLPMEAMAAGVPVLGSDCVGLREVLNGTPSVMAPAGDPAALAVTLRDAIASPWTAAAREYAATARARFDVSRAASQLHGVFEGFFV